MRAQDADIDQTPLAPGDFDVEERIGVLVEDDDLEDQAIAAAESDSGAGIADSGTSEVEEAAENFPESPDPAVSSSETGTVRSASWPHVAVPAAQPTRVDPVEVAPAEPSIDVSEPDDLSRAEIEASGETIVSTGDPEEPQVSSEETEIAATSEEGDDERPKSKARAATSFFARYTGGLGSSRR